MLRHKGKLALVLVGALLLFFLTGKYWNGRDKLDLVVPTSSGDVLIVSFDPSLDKITTLRIPGETQVEVSRNLGIWRIKNVWQLGKQEKIGSKLLSETVVKNFSLPVYLWYKNSNLEPENSCWRLLGETNLGWKDRLKLTSFCFRVPEVDRNYLDLGKTQVLKKARLTDGEEGFLITQKNIDSLAIYFSETLILQKGTKIALKDYTGQPLISEKVGQTLQILGGKVVVVGKENKDENLDCEVWGKEKKVVAKIARIYSCSSHLDSSLGFDVEFRFGQKFAERF